ncbi:MAG: hypothetical protein AB8I69_05320, partial [Anaerolineae bacterium]
RKPSYRVTRKEHVYAWYWRETLPQTVLLVALVVASAYHIATHSMLTETDLGSLFWAAFFGLALSRVVLNAWHGLHPAKAIAKWLRRPLGTARTKVAPTTVEIDE